MEEKVKWTPENEQSTLEAFAKQAQQHDFQCVCCQKWRKPADYGYSRMYKARSRLIAQAIPEDNRGFYNVCGECASLPAAQKDAIILQALVRKGLMDPGAHNV